MDEQSDYKSEPDKQAMAQAKQAQYDRMKKLPTRTREMIYELEQTLFALLRGNVVANVVQVTGSSKTGEALRRKLVCEYTHKSSEKMIESDERAIAFRDALWDEAVVKSYVITTADKV